MTVLGTDYRKGKLPLTRRRQESGNTQESRPSTSASSRIAPSDMHVKTSGQVGVAPASQTDPLKDYILGERLGQGSFAVVRKAVSRPSGRSVAIKTYEKARLLDDLRKCSVAQESALLSSLSHPNIVHLQCEIETSTHIHLVMEYIEGLSLHSVVKQRDRKRLEYIVKDGDVIVFRFNV